MTPTTCRIRANNSWARWKTWRPTRNHARPTNRHPRPPSLEHVHGDADLLAQIAAHPLTRNELRNAVDGLAPVRTHRSPRKSGGRVAVPVGYFDCRKARLLEVFIEHGGAQIHPGQSDRTRP